MVERPGPAQSWSDSFQAFASGLAGASSGTSSSTLNRGGGADALYFAAYEQQGIVFVWGRAGAQPDAQPYAVPTVNQPGYLSVLEVVEGAASVHAVIENALDVPHTAFLHRGLFRGSSQRNRIQVRVTRGADFVQAEYMGEPRPSGLVGWLLAPGGGEVVHFDRFLMPSIAQVEYRLGEANHILVTAFCTPVEEFRTRIHALVSLRLRLPAVLLRPFITPLAMHIFAQDARVLAAQTRAVRSFGGERYASTEIDVLGPQIWRLLRRSQLGRSSPAEDGAELGWVRELEIEV